MKSLLRVLPQVGVDQLRFGMTLQEVVAVLGADYEARESRDADERGELEFEYVRHGLILTLSGSPELRLCSITCESPFAVLNRRPLVGVPEEELSALPGEFVVEDDFPELDARDYWSETFGISIWCKSGRAVRFTLFPEYDNDEPVWPTGEPS